MNWAVTVFFDFLASFTTQIAIGELLFFKGLGKRKHYPLRVLLYVPFVLASVIWGILHEGSLARTPFFMAGWFSWFFLCMVGLSSLIGWFCYDAPYSQILFYCVAAHIIQHLAYLIRSLLGKTLLAGAPEMKICLVGFVVDVIVWGLTYFLLICRITKKRAVVPNRALFLFVVVASVMVNVLNYWAWAFQMQSVATLVYELLSSAFLLVIQFDLCDRSQSRLERELTAQMFHDAKRQQALSADTISLLNRKCHDMKHQIAALERTEDQEERRRSVEELRRTIAIYDDMSKTGNSALDTLLSEKHLQCHANQIQFTHLVDGNAFSFLRDADLYALLGNALDNAIESVSKEEKENRIITMNAAEKSGFLTIVIDNYCGHSVTFTDGLPVTTKENRDYHGFGVQSIRFITQSYGGRLNFKYIEEEKRFVLTMVFPMAG